MVDEWGNSKQPKLSLGFVERENFVNNKTAQHGNALNSTKAMCKSK